MAKLTPREQQVLKAVGFTDEAIGVLDANARRMPLLAVLRVDAVLGPLFVPLVALACFLAAVFTGSRVVAELGIALVFGLWLIDLVFQAVRLGFWTIHPSGSGLRMVLQASRAASYGFVDHREFPKAQLVDFAKSVTQAGDLDKGLRAEMRRIIWSRARLMGAWVGVQGCIGAFIAYTSIRLGYWPA